MPNSNTMPNSIAPQRVGLLVTCLADLVRPQVGFAAITLLERAGCTVEVPLAQTCCGHRPSTPERPSRRPASPASSSGNSRRSTMSSFRRAHVPQ